MSTQAHTPGPWQFGPSTIRGTLCIMANDTWICGELQAENETAISDDECLANACLIAAAPDMLAALKETVLQLQYLADKFGETGTGAAVLARVNAAIAKSEDR